MKFVILSHSHPRFSKGGGELAAWFQFQGLQQAGHKAWFMARHDPLQGIPGLEFNSINSDEFLIYSNTDFFLSTSLQLNINSPIVQWFKKEQPDVVHFHHYLHIGVELIRMVRKTCPNAKIVLTFHEFMAICTNNGQMIKNNQHRTPCFKSGHRECSVCMPAATMDDFFLREHYIKSFFKLVDIYISPSKFVKNRYLEWGLPEDTFHLLEYGLASSPRVPPRKKGRNSHFFRFSFFGQNTPYKGLDVILEAFRLLPENVRSQVRLNVYGSDVADWFKEYNEKIQKLLKINEDIVKYHGPYEQHELPALMAGTDWVVMGSIWWENSPLVIQESYIYGRPVICSDIGGMAEKVNDGVTGRHFRAGDPSSLADVIQDVCLLSEQEYQKYIDNLPVPWGIERMTSAYLELLK